MTDAYVPEQDIWSRSKRWLLRWRRPRERIVQPYTDQATLRRKVARVAFPVGFALFCFVYGFFFALTAPYLIVPFATPIAILVLMSIWALPDRPHAPTKTMELFFSAMILSLILWPNYLALSLPGLPWITAIRLTGIPMAGLLLISLSSSGAFRKEVKEAVTAIPNLWVWFAAFSVVQVLTLAVATSISASLQRVIIYQITWPCVAIATAWVCRMPGRSQRYIMMLMLTAIPMAALTILEATEKRVLWLGHVPSFLKIDDPIAAVVFSSITRSATGMYRAKVTFSTPLGLAEYFALLAPFAIHFAVNKYRLWLRVLSWIYVPLSFYCIRLTDSRLGVVGLLVSILLYLLFWGMLRFRRNRRDLLAATIMYAYPAVFTVAAVAVQGIKSLNTLIFGGGAQAASNAAREAQIAMGLPKILSRPWGHGAGGSGGAMGYAPGQFVTIDNYYLSLGLDYGVVGLTVFIAMFLITISWSVRAALKMHASGDRESTLLIPLAVTMSAFLVIKTVFSQQDIHPMVFMFMGMAMGLSWRAEQIAKRIAEEAENAAAEGGEAIPKLRPRAPLRSKPALASVRLDARRVHQR